MGRVKELLPEDHEGPDDRGMDDYEGYVETLRLQAQQTESAYMAFLATVPNAYARTKDQQREVDVYLRAKMAAYYAMIHAGVEMPELPVRNTNAKV